jgi:hypothetical protein
MTEKSAVGATLDFRIMSGYEKSSINAKKKAVRNVSKQLLHFSAESFGGGGGM